MAGAGKWAVEWGGRRRRCASRWRGARSAGCSAQSMCAHGSASKKQFASKQGSKEARKQVSELLRGRRRGQPPIHTPWPSPEHRSGRRWRAPWRRRRPHGGPAGRRAGADWARRLGRRAISSKRGRQHRQLQLHQRQAARESRWAGEAFLEPGGKGRGSSTHLSAACNCLLHVGGGAHHRVLDLAGNIAAAGGRQGRAEGWDEGCWGSGLEVVGVGKRWMRGLRKQLARQ